jgi:hypothetical protein
MHVMPLGILMHPMQTRRRILPIRALCPGPGYRSQVLLGESGVERRSICDAGGLRNAHFDHDLRGNRTVAEPQTGYWRFLPGFQLLYFVRLLRSMECGTIRDTANRILMALTTAPTWRVGRFPASQRKNSRRRRRLATAQRRA